MGSQTRDPITQVWNVQATFFFFVGSGSCFFTGAGSTWSFSSATIFCALGRNCASCSFAYSPASRLIVVSRSAFDAAAISGRDSASRARGGAMCRCRQAQSAASLLAKPMAGARPLRNFDPSRDDCTREDRAGCKKFCNTNCLLKTARRQRSIFQGRMPHGLFVPGESDPEQAVTF
jgi:hypothetical protein